MIVAVVVNLYGVISRNPFDALMSRCPISGEDVSTLRRAEREYCFGSRNLDYLIDTYSLKLGVVRETVLDELAKPISIDVKIAEVISALKANGIKTVLLANIGQDMVGSVNSDEIKQVFDKSLFSFETGMALPDPKVFRDIAKRFSLTPQEILFIDASDENLSAAQSLKVRTLKYSFDSDLLKSIVMAIAG
jgi:FMN phosphatase YigB (HAD superfamily)